MRILVVDDDPDFRALIARALRTEFDGGTDITQITDRASLDAALAAKPLPELLVSDLSLRWDDGFGILQAVRSINPLCAAVMCTGTGNEDLAVRAMKAGFDDYIVKSSNQLRRLATAARMALERIQTRRGLEENRDLLTRELYHRLHNNLQLVTSLIAFTARSIDDAGAREKLNDLGGRVQSLSLLQERLYRGGDFGRIDFKAFLEQLVDNVTALDTRNIAVRFEVEEAALLVDVAIPLGLVANELVTNSLKHAFKHRAEGELLVALTALDPDAHILEISDNGSGISGETRDANAPGGLGMRLVRRLIQQVGGEMESFARPSGGMSWRVTVPGRPHGSSAS
jgi:two-component sensor histidine kinase